MRRRDLLLGAAGLPRSGRDEDRLAAAAARIERAVAAGEVRAAVLHASRGGRAFTRAFGEAAGQPDTVFLLASITKPMTAAAAMKLVDRGRLALADPVGRHVPEFAGGDRGRVTVRHLLTHTSGLPDMLPENLALRRRFAPLSEFVAGACATPLLFEPGTRVSYQSMGILLLAEIVERLSGIPLREILGREIFQPLGMRRTSLGLGGRRIDDTARCQGADEPWGWNSAYWRDLGAPWGGAHGTAGDVERFLRAFAHPTGRPLRAGTAASMVSRQSPAGAEAWGLGWRLGLGGRGCSARTYGHYGSTGTLCWLDPARDLAFVLLTTWPLAESRTRLLEPVSDLVSEAFS